jgi:hypothetical protein
MVNIRDCNWEAGVLATSCTKPYGGILQVKAAGAGGVGGVEGGILRVKAARASGVVDMEATLQKYPLHVEAKNRLHLTGYY